MNKKKKKRNCNVCGKRRIKNAFQTENEILAGIGIWNEIYSIDIDIVFEALSGATNQT